MALALVADRATGEIQEAPTLASLTAENVILRDEMSELMRKFKGQSRELAELRRDREAEAEADKLWPLGLRVFAYHNAIFRHPRAEWTAVRFEMVRRPLKKRGLEDCLRAISGHRRARWYVEHGKTMFEDVFETTKNFEQAIALCPRDWRPPLGAQEFL